MGLLGDNIDTTESAGLTWSQSNARLPLLSGMESEILSAKVDISPCISRNKPTTSRPPSQFLLLVGQYIHTVNQKGWASRTPQQWEIPALKFYKTESRVRQAGVRWQQVEPGAPEDTSFLPLFLFIYRCCSRHSGKQEVGRLTPHLEIRKGRAGKVKVLCQDLKPFQGQRTQCSVKKTRPSQQAQRRIQKLSVDQNTGRDDENSAGVLSLMTSHLWQPLIWNSVIPTNPHQICIQPQTGGIRVLGTGSGLGFFFFLHFLSNSKEKLNYLEVLVIPPGESNLIHKSCLVVKKKDH